MEIKEIKADELNPEKFIEKKIEDISNVVDNGLAISALSGGVDSSAVTILGHRALGERLKTYFIDNGLMRRNEPEQIISIFRSLGVNVERINAQDKFFNALRGITDPEEKREAISQTFYKDVFADILRKSDAKYLLHGTILTDVEETVSGIKRQHNIFEQVGIDPEEAFGYKIIEPIVNLRKDGVRTLAESLGLPKSVYNRPPFPGPALAARVIGEVTPERVEIVRKATTIVEEELESTDVFQCMAILHQDRVTGIRDGQRDFGLQIEVRCWDSVDARIASPTRLSHEVLNKISEKIVENVSNVVSVTYNITKKPPSTMEAV